jgi:hypothetical protein
MCDEQNRIGRGKPSVSLLLWFLGITAFMVAIAHYA